MIDASYLKVRQQVAGAKGGHQAIGLTKDENKKFIQQVIKLDFLLILLSQAERLRIDRKPMIFWIA